MGLCSLSSCSSKEKRSDASFYIPEVGIHVTTSKRPEYVYVIFDTIPRTIESDSVDYIKIKINEYSTIMFDKMYKDSIHVRAWAACDIHPVKYKFEHIDKRPAKSFAEINEYFENKFYIVNDNDTKQLKSRYINFRINTRYYDINIGDTLVKKGSVTGGW